MAATSVGNYALFGGGYTGSSASAVIDAYNVNMKVVIPKGSKYKLNSGTEITASDMTVLSLACPVSGYIEYKNGGIIS